MCNRGIQQLIDSYLNCQMLYEYKKQRKRKREKRKIDKLTTFRDFTKGEEYIMNKKLITDYSFVKCNLPAYFKHASIEDFLFLYLETDDIIIIQHRCQCLGRDCGF